MNDGTTLNQCGDIRRIDQSAWPGPPYRMGAGATIPLPATDAESARDFLEGIGGGALGAGRAMNRIGVDAPALRVRYKEDIEAMIAEVQRRVSAGESPESIAKWVSGERNRIVNTVRASSGLITRGIYEVRDWREYGPGGRTWSNIQQRYEARGFSGPAMHDEIISSAQRSNPTVNTAAMRGASYLRHGGRVIVVVGVGITAARIWNASDTELPRVIGEELGGYIGGGVGAGTAVGLCIIFGVASAGWGLLACGVVGGIGGGVAGSLAGGAIADGIYYSDVRTPPTAPGEVAIVIPSDRLYDTPPAALCHP